MVIYAEVLRTISIVILMICASFYLRHLVKTKRRCRNLTIMRKYHFVILFLIGMFIHSSSEMAEAKHNTNERVPFLEQLMTHSLKFYEVHNIKMENDSGQQRVFSINDGFQERVLRKVTYWLNNASRVNGTIEVSLDHPSNTLTLKMANDEVITIEPAYTCVVHNKRKICTAKDGELIISENNQKIRLKSQSLYDWLAVGWRKELNGPTKEELLEEALFTRYLYSLGPSYDDFFMCLKIKIEPIDGDPRRHLIFASALNYAGHHGGDFDKLTFSVKDSNLTGLQITNIKIDKHISQEESQKQCQTYD